MPNALMGLLSVLAIPPEANLSEVAFAHTSGQGPMCRARSIGQERTRKRKAARVRRSLRGRN